MQNFSLVIRQSISNFKADIVIIQAPALPVINGAKDVHSFVLGSYCSTVFKYWFPSYPPAVTRVSLKRQVATASLLLERGATVTHVSIAENKTEMKVKIKLKCELQVYLDRIFQQSQI